MKTNGGKKSVKKPAKKKGKLGEWFINIFAIVLFGGGLVYFVLMTTQTSGPHSKEVDPYLASLPAQGDTISHNKICMVDDIYQGDYPTLSVGIAGRTYFGCDTKAILDLSSKQDIRFAIDPVTKKKVDKATAVIGIHPKRDGKVVYFESRETFTEFYSQKIK